MESNRGHSFSVAERPRAGRKSPPRIRQYYVVEAVAKRQSPSNSFFIPDGPGQRRELAAPCLGDWFKYALYSDKVSTTVSTGARSIRSSSNVGSAIQKWALSMQDTQSYPFAVSKLDCSRSEPGQVAIRIVKVKRVECDLR